MELKNDDLAAKKNLKDRIENQKYAVKGLVLVAFGSILKSISMILTSM